MIEINAAATGITKKTIPLSRNVSQTDVYRCQKVGHRAGHAHGRGWRTVIPEPKRPKDLIGRNCINLRRPVHTGLYASKEAAGN
jgi:hypothetical protein